MFRYPFWSFSCFRTEADTVRLFFHTDASLHCVLPSAVLMPGRLSDRSARFPAIVPEHADFLSTPLLLLHWFFPVLPGLVLAVRRSLPWQNLSGFRLPLSVCRGSVHPVSISAPAFWGQFHPGRFRKMFFFQNFQVSLLSDLLLFHLLRDFFFILCN